MSTTPKRDAKELYTPNRGGNDKAAELLAKFQFSWIENKIAATAAEQTALIAAFTAIIAL